MDKAKSGLRGEAEVGLPSRLDVLCLTKARRRIEEIVAENVHKEFVQKAARDEIKRFQKASDSDAHPVEETASAKPNASSKDSGMRFSVSSECRWSIGRRPDLSYDHLIQISLSSRHVPPNVYAKKFNVKTNLIEHVEIGSITQFPLKLAWGLTIHKGQTLEEVYVDLIDVFACGQTYTALSRVRTLQGLHLVQRFDRGQILSDQRVSNWL